MHTNHWQKNILLFSFLCIPIILMALLVIYPTFKLFQISFTDWDGLSQTMNYIGMNNYKKVILDSPKVWLSLKNNGIYFFIHLLAIPVEIFVAFILDRKIKASKFFKTVLFMPYIINGVAVSYMFSLFFSSEGGALNMILNMFHIEGVNWLSDAGIVNYALTSVSLWRFCGLHVVLFLAAMQSIPQDMLEAAKIDGASTFDQFIKIILPNIKTVVAIVLFLNVRGALQVFDIPFVMTGGGPGHASSTFTLHTIETAFNFNSFGKACAMAVCLMVLIIVISFIQKKVLGSEE